MLESPGCNVTSKNKQSMKCTFMVYRSKDNCQLDKCLWKLFCLMLLVLKNCAVSTLHF